MLDVGAGRGHPVVADASVGLERRKMMGVVIAVVKLLETRAASAMRRVTRSARYGSANSPALKLRVPCIWTV
jgi:hypothetical protein